MLNKKQFLVFDRFKGREIKEKTWAVGSSQNSRANLSSCNIILKS
jgi:hypothetical protein